MNFPRSVVLHSREEVYKFTGFSEIAPHLLQGLDPEKVSALQFLKNGSACVSLKTATYMEELLRESSFLYNDIAVPVTAADTVFHPSYYQAFPSVGNGTHILHMSFQVPLPSSLNVAEYPVRVWHLGQHVVCSMCRESGHLPWACPYSRLCLKCKQPGHAVKDCARA